MYRNIAEVIAFNGYQLGALINVSPENDAAVSFLTGIRNAVIEATENIAADDWHREMVEDHSGLATEIADGAPSVYTWRKWQEFIGLSAWQDDITDFEIPGDVDGYYGAMDAGASLSLFVMARRLVTVLVEQVAPNDDNPDYPVAGAAAAAALAEMDNN